MNLMTNILNLSSYDLGRLALSQLSQVTLVALVVGLVARRIQHSRPHLSHALWILVILKCITPPLWSSPTGVFSWIDTRIEDPETAFLNAEAPTFIPADDSVVERREMGEFPAAAREMKPESKSFARSLAPFFPSQVITVLLLTWVAGSGLVLGLAILQWRDCIRVLRRTRVPTPRAVELALASVKEELGVRRHVRVLVTESGLGPMVFGYFRPLIILPLDLVDCRSPQRIRPVIAHEMIHARRGDTVFGLCQFLSQVVWWFHPLVWWANRQANLVCELCCDEEVVSQSSCRPREYAECLLDVLELRHRLRPVWALSGVRTAEITTKRMERIMRLAPASMSRRRWGRIMMLLAALLLLPGARWVQATGQQAKKQQPRLQSNADMFFAEKDWEGAARAYRKLVEKNPKDGRSWFRLGYALHSAGKIDEAIEAHKKAAEFPRAKPIALYNLACAYALQKKHDDALKQLEIAIKSGFRSQRPLKDDGDFAGLLDNDRFKELAKQARPLSQQEVYRQFDFWVGDWDVYGRNGKKVGTNKITKDERGFLLVEKWHNIQGSTGTSMSFYDQSTKQWKQHWVDAGGNLVRYSGNVKNGKMHFKGESILADGRRELSRVTFTPLPDGRVRQFIERSSDQGSTWKVYFDGHYVRKDSSPGATVADEPKKSDSSKKSDTSF